MKGSDLLVPGFPHGTPAGYEAGCRGGICPAVMSCRTVWMRVRSDLDFRRQYDAGVCLPQILAAELAASAADLAETRAEYRAWLAARKPAPSLSTREEWSDAEDAALREQAQAGRSAWQASLALGRAPKTIRRHAQLLGLDLRDGRAGRTIPRNRHVPALGDPDYPHGTIEGYQAGCFGVDCPASPTCAEVNLIVHGVMKAPRVPREPRVRPPRVPREKPPAEHGSLTMYLRGCRDDSCEASPSCSEVAHAYYLEHNRASVRKVQPHGTNASYLRCRTDEGCPNFGTDQPTCREANRVYYAAWMAKKRARGIPAENHGTAYGYQLGCKAGAPCPATPSCAEVQRIAEKARDRANGLPEAEPLTDAAPVREHVRSLLESMTLDQVADRAGVHRSQLGNLVYGRSGGKGRRGGEMLQVTASRAERIMAVQP